MEKKVKVRSGSAILLVVAGMVFLVILGTMLLQSTKERDLAAHNMAYERACHEIALSAANVTFLAFKRSLVLQDQWDPENEKKNNDLLTFLMKDDLNLFKKLEKFHDEGEEQEKELKLLLGEDFLLPIEQAVLPYYKGASVKVALHLIPSPLYKDIPDTEDYCDPFERNFTVTVCANATWGKTQRTVVLKKEARMNSLLPPATGKFVFMCKEPRSDDINSRCCSADGVSVTEGVEPLWRIFANDDGETLKQELEKESKSEGSSEWSTSDDGWRQLVGDLTLDTLQEEYKDSGFIFFGRPTFEDRAALKVPAGEEDHVLSNSHFIEEERQRAKEAPSQPRAMADMSGTMRPFVQGLFAGFHNQTKATGLFGPSLDNDNSSRLQLFGTKDSPCPTLVIGDVVSRCARVTDMAMDRDKEMTDEEEQRAIVGHYLPARETIDPFFVCVEADDYATAITREVSNPLQVAPLRPFCSPSLIGEAIARTPENEPVRFGLLENLNASVSNGQESPPVQVTSEIAYNPIVIPIPTFGYANFFENWDEYCTYASSGQEQFSFNLLAKTMTMEPQQAFMALWENRLMEPQALTGSEGARHPSTGTCDEEKLTIPFSTKLHKEAGIAPLFDNERNKGIGLAKLPVQTMLSTRAITAMTMEEFKQRFMSGTDKDTKRDLDLRGLTIRIVDSFVLKPYKDKKGPITITIRKRYGLENHMRPEVSKGSKREFWLDGGGAIVTDSAQLNDIVLVNEDGDEETPFVLCSSDLSLRIPFYLDALIDGQSFDIVKALHYQGKDPPPQQINGALHIGDSSALKKSHALDINYETRYDPTKETMARHYRGFVSDSIYSWSYGRQSFDDYWSDVRATWDESKAISEEEKK